MKKQFIAKLLVLVMILAMVPATALAAGAAGTNAGSNNAGSNSGSGSNTIIKDTDVFLPIDSGTSAAAAALGSDKVTVEEGTAVIKATVVDGTATAMLTDAAVKKLAGAVKDGEITLVIDDEGASELNVCFPARALTTLAKKTGADLTIESSVATITLSNALITKSAGVAGVVKITAATAESDVAASIWVKGKELKNVEGFEVNA